MRRHYIDNLRWLILLVLIPYHAAMAWNAWGEPNYIYFEPSRVLSSIVVFFSPFFMPLLFVLAGISTRLALCRRTAKEYLAERTKKLLVPFLFGTLGLMPILCWLADRFNCGYEGGFFGHYAVFFTRFTDLIGADGGFSMGQFWFLLYLMVISLLCVGVLTLLKKTGGLPEKTLPFPAVLALGLPLPLLNEVLSVGGKSLAGYTWLFLLGYFVFADENTITSAAKHRLPLLLAGLGASGANIYLFLWTDGSLAALNTACSFAAGWLMVLALLGLAKQHLDFSGKLCRYMNPRSFLVYIFHFVWVVLFEYLLAAPAKGNAAVIFFGTVLLSFAATFVCCEITLRIPLLCLLTGTKYQKGRKENGNQKIPS